MHRYLPGEEFISWYRLGQLFALLGSQLQNLKCFVPRTSIDEIISTSYAKFRYLYRIFLSDSVSKIEEFKFRFLYRIFLSGRVSNVQRNLNSDIYAELFYQTGLQRYRGI